MDGYNFFRVWNSKIIVNGGDIILYEVIFFVEILIREVRFERAERFLEGFLLGVIYGYCFIDGFYLSCEYCFSIWKFFESELRNFSDDVIDRRFKRRRRFERNIVRDVVEGVIDCKFCSYFSDWKISCFGS